MYRSNRNETCLANGYQRVRYHLGGRMRLCLVGCFLQVQSGAKRCACSAQNYHALVRLIGSDLDGGV